MVMTGWADEEMAFLGLLVWVGLIHTYLIVPWWDSGYWIWLAGCMDGRMGE